MASPAYKPEDFWPDVAVFEEHEVIQLFANYELLRFNVHRSSGTSAVGEQHHWHLYSIVARKQGRSLFA